MCRRGPPARRKSAAVERADELGHVDGDAPAVARREAKRLDAGIDRRELTAPSTRESLIAMDTSTLDRVWPIDIGVHEGERGLNLYHRYSTKAGISQNASLVSPD
jgi:hypothetical protein